MQVPNGFLKRHGFLIAGVALPIAVVVAFVLARTLPRLWVDAPRYDVLYAVRSGYDQTPDKLSREIVVVDGALRVRWTKVENPVYGQPTHVFRFRGASGDVDEVRLPDPAPFESLGPVTELPVGGLEGLRVETSPRAPDGYEYETPGRDGSGFMSEIFIRRQRGPKGVIAKGGRVIALPRSEGDPYDYSPIQFLGWLVPAGGAR